MGRRARGCGNRAAWDVRMYVFPSACVLHIFHVEGVWLSPHGIARPRRPAGESAAPTHPRFSWDG
eukprot:8079613-Pyramimonas_sp.AAC.1